MPRISETDQEVLDLDWFGSDMSGMIGHFTTGGFGAIPESVGASAEHLDVVTNYFHSLLRRTAMPTTPFAASSAIQHTSFPSDADAALGLFSFDYAPSAARPTGYVRTGVPRTPCYIKSVPLEIQAILQRTILQVAFPQATEIPLTSVLSVGRLHGLRSKSP